MEAQYLFAYGTLQPEGNLGFFEENKLSQFLKIVGPAIIQGALLHLRNLEKEIDYPALVDNDDPESLVQGTLFEITDSEKVFPIMDPYEGYNPEFSAEDSVHQNFYERTEIDAVLENGDSVKAHVYKLNRASDFFNSETIVVIGPVPSGNWLEYVRQLAK